MVEADIETQNVEIAGRVTGNIVGQRQGGAQDATAAWWATSRPRASSSPTVPPSRATSTWTSEGALSHGHREGTGRQAASGNNTVVGQSILISGKLTGDEDLTVRGRVEGELTLSRDAHRRALGRGEGERGGEERHRQRRGGGQHQRHRERGAHPRGPHGGRHPRPARHHRGRRELPRPRGHGRGGAGPRAVGSSGAAASGVRRRASRGASGPPRPVRRCRARVPRRPPAAARGPSGRRSGGPSSACRPLRQRPVRRPPAPPAARAAEATRPSLLGRRPPRRSRRPWPRPPRRRSW